MNRNSSQVQIVWGHKTPNIDRKLNDIIPWVRDAGRPYYDIFLDGTDLDSTIARWLQRRSSEVSLQRTRLLVTDDRITGGYISLAGRELPGCRQADLLDLAREMGEHSYSELRARMDDLRDLFAPVEENDFYLSKIGVLSHMQGQGLSHHLMRDCIRRATQGGFRRVRLDVPEHHKVARELYRTHDFEPVYRGKTPVSNLRYIAMVCDL